MKSYGFGIISVGMISHFHAKAINALDNARLVAVCSRSEDKATSFSQQYGCRAYTSLEAMLADDRVDIVTVCTPSGAHLEPTVAAANANVHVICEKPLEITLSRIDSMITAHRDAGTMLCGIFPYRYSDVVVQIKHAIDAGRFGRLTVAGAYVPWWRDQQYYDDGGWKGTQQLDGGGALMNQSIHAIDSLIWLMGDVESVSAHMATLAHTSIDVEDTATATLRFKNGALGVIMGTTSAYPGSLRRLEICGDSGTAVCVEDDLVTWSFRQPYDDDDAIRKQYAAATNSGGGASDPAAISFDGHRRNFAACLHALEHGQPAPIDGHESRRAVEVILAIYASAREQRPIQLPLSSPHFQSTH